MRPPVVQRPTSPTSGWLRCSASKAWRRDPRAPCSGVLALGGPRAHGAAPHTSGGATARAMAMAASRATVVCTRAPSLYSDAVLRPGGAARVRAPMRCRCGCGAAHRHPQELAPAGWARAQASPHVDTSAASGAGADHELPVSPRERQRPGGASPRAAARRLWGHRAGRVWRCPQGWPAWSGQAPAQRADRRARSGRPAKSQVKRPSTQTTSSIRSGAMVSSHGAGPAGMCRCTSISPSRLKIQRDHGCGRAGQGHQTTGAVGGRIA